MIGFFKSPAVKTIAPAEAFEQAKSGKIQLVDVREPGEWAQGHIPGALHAPLSNLAKTLPGLPASKPIVFYCLSGKRSASAVAQAKELGLAHDTHMAGGISGWMASGLPVER